MSEPKKFSFKEQQRLRAGSTSVSRSTPSGSRNPSPCVTNLHPLPSTANEGEDNASVLNSAQGSVEPCRCEPEGGSDVAVVGSQQQQQQAPNGPFSLAGTMSSSAGSGSPFAAVPLSVPRPSSAAFPATQPVISSDAFEENLDTTSRPPTRQHTEAPEIGEDASSAAIAASPPPKRRASALGDIGATLPPVLVSSPRFSTANHAPSYPSSSAPSQPSQHHTHSHPPASSHHPSHQHHPTHQSPVSMSSPMGLRQFPPMTTPRAGALATPQSTGPGGSSTSSFVKKITRVSSLCLSTTGRQGVTGHLPSIGVGLQHSSSSASDGSSHDSTAAHVSRTSSSTAILMMGSPLSSTLERQRSQRLARSAEPPKYAAATGASRDAVTEPRPAAAVVMIPSPHYSSVSKGLRFFETAVDTAFGAVENEEDEEDVSHDNNDGMSREMGVAAAGGGATETARRLEQLLPSSADEYYDNPLLFGSLTSKASIGTTVRAIVGGATLVHANEVQESEFLRSLAVRSTAEFIYRYGPPVQTESGSSQGAGRYDALLPAGYRGHGDALELCYEDEAGRYMGGPRINGDPVNDEGRCLCSDSDVLGLLRCFDYSPYHAHTLTHHCVHCFRRPGAFVCLNCFQSVCPSHVDAHHKASLPSSRNAGKGAAEGECFLFLNTLDIRSSYDRSLWCERHRQFTWKFYDAFEPLMEHILSTEGSYLTEPIRELHIQSHLVTLASQAGAPRVTLPSTNPTPGQSPPMGVSPSLESTGTLYNLVSLGASLQGWRTSQEDSELVCALQVPSWLIQDTDESVSSIESNSQAPLAADWSAPLVDPASPVASSQQQTSAKRWSTVSCCCVFDGHGGDAVAKLAATSLEGHLQRAVFRVDHDYHHHHAAGRKIQFDAVDDDKLESGGSSSSSTRSSGNNGGRPVLPYLERVKDFFERVFTDAFVSFDDALRTSKEGRQGDYNCVGCTACCVVHCGNQHVVCANLGDSGAMLFALPDRDTAQQTPTSTVIMTEMLSTPHRITDDSESARIRNAGYSVYSGRIEGLLAVTRALGDFEFKQCQGGPLHQAVSVQPTVTVRSLEDLNQTTRPYYVLAACDGVWDTLLTPTAVAKAMERALPSCPATTSNAAAGMIAAGGTPPKKKTSDDICLSQVRGGVVCPEMLSLVSHLLVQCVADRKVEDSELDDAKTEGDEDKGIMGLDIGLDNCSALLIRCSPK